MATCARPGCDKPLPEVAVRHGDPFCSAACSKVHHGIITEAQAADSANRSARGLLGAEAGWRPHAEASYALAEKKKRREAAA